MAFFSRFLERWFPQLDAQIWILAFGRLLSQIGTGFTLFYAPIFFVNQVGLSSTAVGIGLGMTQISGILGRILGGSLADAPAWGRRRTLLLSAVISAIASFTLALTHNFTTLILGNLLAGLGIGLYWPATEAVVADLTTGKQRNEAYALTRFGDSLGLQLGILLAGILVATTQTYRALFVIDGLSFIGFFGVILKFITESRQPSAPGVSSLTPWQGWAQALQDRTLMIYIVINTLSTLYISQIHTTIPLYFSNFITPGFSPGILSGLFTWHITISAIALLPLARQLGRLSHAHALTISALLWGIGFVLIGWTGTAEYQPLILAIFGLGVLALATVSYTPSASALVADLAPSSLRGTYLAINAQCWAIGYLIGAPLGGWVLDQTPQLVYNFWIVLAISTGIVVVILQQLNTLIMARKTQSQE
ncbi:MAG: MFS transporter [Oscillatoriales cyanobacterium RM2_1_1]|nr:MFS transporter [Oscillatoriales cyanobacterium SM2_3_0]NJO46232.1 MFS transporter [Oscillatoriales cyanobacterium RM2_1_1]